MSKSLNQNPTQLTAEFNSLSSWEEKYKKIIAWGRELPAYPEKFREEKFKVKGCQSQVWLHAEIDSKGIIHFEADSDALLVKGLIAMLMKVFNSKSPREILDTPLDFVKEIGLEQNLTPSRTNGLVAMIKQIKTYAQAFELLKTHKNA